MEVVAALQLSFIPPRGARVGQRRDDSACLLRVARAPAAEHKLEVAFRSILTVLKGICDEVAHLVDRRDVSMSCRGEKGSRSIKACGSTHRPAMWPESANLDRRMRALDGRGQQGHVMHLIVPPTMGHWLARPVAHKESEALVESLG